MAENTDFNIRFGAETQDLEKGIDRAQKQIQTLAKAQGKLNAEFLEGKISAEQLEKGMTKLQSTSNRYVKAVSSVQRNMGGLGKTMNANAVPAMQEFSRVIQDAPYGIQGVANNIQQLTAQFGYLSAKSGGAKAALRGMVGALAGPAGILLAVSIVTAALPALIKAFSKSEDATKNLKFSLDDLSTSYKRQIQLIKDEITEANRLLSLDVARAKSILASEKEISKIKQKALDESIVRLEEEKKIVQQTISDVRSEVAKIFPNIGEVPEKYADTYDDAQKKISNLVRRGEKINQEIKKASADKQILIYADQQRETEKVNDESVKNREDAEKKKTEDEKRELAERLRANKAYYKAVAALQSAIRGRKAGVTDFRTEDNTPKSDKGDIAGDGGVTTSSVDALLVAGDRLAEAADVGGEKLTTSIQQTATLAGQAAQVLSKHMANIFTGIGEMIGTALGGGASDIELGGKALLKAFGKFLGELGTMAIAYGSFMLAMEIAKNAGGPWGAAVLIAAGIAMVAIGKAIDTKVGEGVGSTSGVVTSGNGSGGSSVSGSQYTPYQGTYSFEIQGTKLVSVINETQTRNGALGGTTTISGI